MRSQTSWRPSQALLRSRWFLGTFLLAAAFWTLDLAVLRAGVPHPLDDNWEDNIIAERLLEGDGFRTRMIYAPLWGLRDPATLTIPVLIHGPLLPLVSVPALALGGAGAMDGVAWAAGLCAVLVTIPVFRVTERHFGAAVGAAAAGLFTLSPLTLQAVHHSGSVVLGALLVAWALDLVARPAPRAPAAGLVLGLCYLVRPEALVALPALAWLAWRSGSAPPAGAHAWRAAAGLVVGFAVAAAPWWIHQTRVAGSPLFNLASYNLIGHWGDRPDNSVLQDFALTPDRWPAVLRGELPGLWPKWVAFFPRAVKHTLFAPSGGTGWLALVGLAAAIAGRAGSGRGTEPGRRLAVAALFLALIPVASMTLANHQRLYLVPFLPLHAIGAALGASVATRAMPPWAHRPRFWLGALTLLMLPTTPPALAGAAREARVLERRLAAERAALARELGPASGRLVFSDSPDFVAWTTGRPTVWMTRAGFDVLYPTGGTELAGRYGLPPRSDVDTWFHGDVRDPASHGTQGAP